MGKMKGKSFFKTAVEMKVLICSWHVLWNCKLVGDAVHIWTWPLNNHFWVDRHPNGEELHVKTIATSFFFLGGGLILHWATQNSFHVNSLLHDTNGSPCQYCAATFVGCVYTVKGMYWIPTKYTCQAVYMYIYYVTLDCLSYVFQLWFEPSDAQNIIPNC
jgi:hypothetical protein